MTALALDAKDMAEVINVCLSELGDLLSKVRRALAADDMPGAAVMGHTMKSTAGNMGAMAFKLVATDLERAAERGETGQGPQACGGPGTRAGQAPQRGMNSIPLTDRQWPLTRAGVHRLKYRLRHSSTRSVSARHTPSNTAGNSPLAIHLRTVFQVTPRYAAMVFRPSSILGTATSRRLWATRRGPPVPRRQTRQYSPICQPGNSLK